jgi:nucleoid-associated protein YgaU
MRACSPAPGLGLWRRAFLLVPLFLCLYSTYSQAQDVAEPARQERARKNEQSPKPHVYTDDDLKRDKILTSEDQERAEARKKENAPRSNVPENAETLPLTPTEPADSLGEIARRYRKEKEEKEAVEAAKKKINPFLYTSPDPVLATPGPEIAPLVRTAPEAPVRKPVEISPLERPNVPADANRSRARLSPFQPRPLLSKPVAPPVLAAPSVPLALFVVPRVIPRSERPVTANESRRPETASLQQIQVQRGDSWWKLAGQYLGSGARWRELRNLNPDATEPAESLQEGSLIRVPETPRARSLSSQPKIVVKKGDTLWMLARTHLGHGSSWSCLASANPQLAGVTRLTIGLVLYMPDPADLRACEASPSGSPSR